MHVNIPVRCHCSTYWHSHMLMHSSRPRPSHSFHCYSRDRKSRPWTRRDCVCVCICVCMCICVYIHAVVCSKSFNILVMTASSLLLDHCARLHVPIHMCMYQCMSVCMYLRSSWFAETVQDCEYIFVLVCVSCYKEPCGTIVFRA
jgi:hypothetical protein